MFRLFYISQNINIVPDFPQSLPTEVDKTILRKPKEPPGLKITAEGGISKNRLRPRVGVKGDR